jgi:exoribonuclease II
LLDKHNLSTFSSEIEAAALGAIQGNETLVAPDAAAPLVDLTDRPYITVDNDDSMDLDQAMFIAP